MKNNIPTNAVEINNWIFDERSSLSKKLALVTLTKRSEANQIQQNTQKKFIVHCQCVHVNRSIWDEVEMVFRSWEKRTYQYKEEKIGFWNSIKFS